MDANEVPPPPTSAGSKRKHEEDSGDGEPIKNTADYARLTMQSPAQKRAFVAAETPAASPMKGVEASPAPTPGAAAKRNLLSAFLKVSEASEPKTRPNPANPPAASTASAPVFGSSAAFGSGKMPITKKTVENEKNPFGSVAFGDAGRSTFQFGTSVFGGSSALGFGAAPTVATDSAASIFGSSSSTFSGSASVFGSSAKTAGTPKSNPSKSEASTDTNISTKPPVSPVSSAAATIPIALKPVSPSTATTTVSFAGSLGGRDSESISHGKDALSSNSTVKAVSFSSSEPAFGSKASSSALSFGGFGSSTAGASNKASSKPSKEEDDGSDDENPIEHEVPIEKKVDIPEVEVKTGEEDESNIIQMRCKLYRMDETNTWKERGVGNLRLNCDESSVSARLVMRAEGVLRLILNVRVLPGMPCQIVQDKFVQFSCCEDVGTRLTRFLVKTANENAALKLLNHIRIFSEKEGDTA
ncbi:hypothetical protein BDR26DRAFT_1015480 [Obelidium mucronatum]|nr:hypothetical protein BDR26DRAFT_1015480 [Obelidium mucronatum]